MTPNRENASTFATTQQAGVNSNTQSSNLTAMLDATNRNNEDNID